MLVIRVWLGMWGSLPVSSNRVGILSFASHYLFVFYWKLECLNDIMCGVLVAIVTPAVREPSVNQK